MARADRLVRPSGSLVLTLEMDGESFAAFDALRRRYYPPDRNRVPAHLALFSRLPGEHRREIKALLAATALRRGPFEIAPGAVKTLERGVAVFVHSPQLHALREALVAEWLPWLDDADQAGFRPHVTIQINVSDVEAAQTRRALAESFQQPRIKGIGLHLWRYRDGPWEHEQIFRFR